MSGAFRLGRQSLKRRVVIGAFAAAATPTCDLAVENRRRNIEEALSAVSAAMADLHGGQWTAHVDHDAGFILVSPQKGPARPLG